MISAKPEQPYFESWRRRAGRQLAVSGRLSQIATVLAGENEGSTEQWRQQLHAIMQGDEIPSIELLTRIDALLVGSAPAPGPTAETQHQESLF